MNINYCIRDMWWFIWREWVTNRGLPVGVQRLDFKCVGFMYTWAHLSANKDYASS